MWLTAVVLMCPVTAMVVGGGHCGTGACSLRVLTAIELYAGDNADPDADMGGR